MDAGRPLRLLAITGGHRVDLDAFTGMLAGICAERGWVFAHAGQPAAAVRAEPVRQLPAGVRLRPR